MGEMTASGGEATEMPAKKTGIRTRTSRHRVRGRPCYSVKGLPCCRPVPLLLSSILALSSRIPYAAQDGAPSH
jgi:hypothetical protein